MSAVMIPPTAEWFWLEVQAPDGAWVRIEAEELGGKWWQIGTTTPEQIAERAGGDAGLTFRANFTPKDKRAKAGQSPPFQVEGAPGVVEPEAVAAPDAVPSEPVASQQAPARPRPPAARAAAAVRGNGNGRVMPAAYVQPKIPMPFTPPPNDPDLARFVLLRSLAQQDTDRFLTMVLSFHQAQTEAAAARSREAVENTRAFFASVERGQRELQTAMLAATKGNETPMVVQQLQGQVAAQTAAITAIGETLTKYEAEDEAASAAQLAQLSENPNNVERVFHGIQGVVASVANTPFGDALADMISRSREGAEPAPAAPQYEQGAPPDDAPPVDGGGDDFDGRTLDDFPDGAAPQ